MQSTKKAGPPNVVRPYQPAVGNTTAEERIMDALEAIAVSLAAIDHNLEVAVRHIAAQRR